jgi:hypothetical protein
MLVPQNCGEQMGKQIYTMLVLLALSVPLSAHAADRACKDNTECDASEMCEKAKGECASVGPMGHCVAKPTSCTGEEEPVCGCDSSTYTSDCVRKKAGTSLNHSGECRGTEQ